MEISFEYHNPSSVAGLKIISPINNDITTSTFTSLPLLSFNFQLLIHEHCWYRPQVGHPQFQGEISHTKSLHDIKISPSIYMSRDDTFYLVLQFHLENWGQEFDQNYRHLVICDIIRTIRQLVEDESNKSRQNMKVFGFVCLVVERFFDEMDWLEESTPRFNGMVPASTSSIMGLSERREIDEDDQRVHDDCVICFEELGKEKKILCLPCSHMFHGDCITTWLKQSHYCPICRYEMPTVDEN